MIRLAITVDDLAPALALLGEASAALGDATPMWDEIGGHFEFATDQRFEREAGPGGVAWPKSLRALATGGKTLTDTSRLRSSVTHNAWATGMEVGTNVQYAGIHQQGGTIRAKSAKGLRWKYQARGGNAESWARKMEVSIPARPFIGIDDDDTEAVTKIAESYLARSFNAHH